MPFFCNHGVVALDGEGLGQGGRKAYGGESEQCCLLADGTGKSG